jgi:hypothetical protein
MVPSSRTPLRPDRLRALNLPSAVEVGIDAWGLPTWVMDDGGTAERRNGGTDIESSPERRSAGPPGWSGGEEGDRRVERVGGEGPPGMGGREERDRRGEGRRVEEVVETWIVQDEWWRSPIHRRYVEVVLEGGAHVVLFEDLITGEWFMQRP